MAPSGPDDPTELDLQPNRSPQPASSLKKPARWPWVVALLLLLGVPVGFYLLTRAPPPAAPVAALDAGAPPAPAVDAGPPRPPPEGEALLRKLLGELGAPPALLSWLEGEGLLRRLVAAVSLIAEGQSPRAMLSFLPVSGGFQAREVQGPQPPKPPKGPRPPRPVRYFIAHASAQRYEGVAAALGAVDAAGFGRVYGELRPYLDAVYSEIGPPGSHFDDALAKAGGVLLGVSIPQGEVELVPKGAVWAYADPALEALSPAQKHLVRMGPAYGGTVQRQLRAFLMAAGIAVR